MLSAGLYVNIEGYWISAGENIPSVNEDFILTETVRQNLKDVARIVSLSKFAVLLQGETSVGKTRYGLKCLCKAIRLRSYFYLVLRIRIHIS